MVKFSKELEAQLIPEWKEAFVNYSELKKYVKKIKVSRTPKINPKHDMNDCGRSMFDLVRYFAKKVSDKLLVSTDEKTEIIQVKRRKPMADGSSDDEDEVYQTELVQLFSEEDEVRVFFERLDNELNKVNQFYKTQESELLERGETLNKQLDILRDIKKILSEGRRKSNVATLLSQSRSSSARNSDFSDISMESSTTLSSESSQTDDMILALEKNGVNFVNSATRTKTKKGKPNTTLRIDIPATNPTRTISALTSMIWEDLVNNTKKETSGEYYMINKKKIQCAEKMIRAAFVELYRGLGLLKTYSSLNMMAFMKILKKFDKVSHEQASASYLKAVKRSHFISSDKIVRLMDEVESIFTKHFASNDSKKAMQFLRPQRPKDSDHYVTFLLGLFTGCLVSLVIVYAILAYLSSIFSSNSQVAYTEIVYPVFRHVLLLHLFHIHSTFFYFRIRFFRIGRIQFSDVKHKQARQFKINIKLNILGLV